MFPKWFDKWNADNPVDIYRPAIGVGVLGGAVVVVALLASFGQPWVTKSQQTGPRGTGMHVPEFKVDIEAPDPDRAGFDVADTVDMAAYRAAEAEPAAAEVEEAAEDVAAASDAEDDPTAEAGATMAEGSADAATDDAAATETADATGGTGDFSNGAIAGAGDLLGNPSDEDFGRLLAAMRQWTGIPDLLDDPENYQSQVALRMIQMTQNLNANWDGHVALNGGGVTCYTCHRGNPVPENVWYKQTPTVERMAGWSANQNRATPISQSTSLPSDALEEYFLNYGLIAVHDLESRVEGTPGQDGYPGIQHAERTYSLMNYFANSLGVNCTFCHNTRAFYDGAQVTPQWGTAQLGIAMVQELNEEYLLPLEGLLPDERLGELHGDVPKAACKTCHQGQQRPLKGLNVIDDYPQLATEGGQPD